MLRKWKLKETRSNFRTKQTKGSTFTVVSKILSSCQIYKRIHLNSKSNEK